MSVRGLANQWLIDLAIAKTTPKGEIKAGVATVRLDKKDLLKAVSKLKKMGENGTAAAAMLKAVLEGERYALDGSIRDRTRDLAWWLSLIEPHADPQHLVNEYLERCWFRMYSPYQPGRIDREWERSWRTALAKHAADKATKAEARASSASSRIEQVTCGARSTPYTDEEVKGLADVMGVDVAYLLSSLLVIQVQRAYYIFYEGDYQGPYTAGVVERARDLLSVFGNRVHVETFVESTGRYRLVDPKDLVHAHGSTAAGVELSMVATKSALQLETNTFVQAVARARDLKPVYSAEVDAWLGRMCGDAYPRVKDWIATAHIRDQAAPLLWFYGGPGRGKSLFPAAMSRLWTTGGDIELEDAVSRFNDAICICPLVFGEETIPRDQRGLPDVEKLKRLVTKTTHRLERKGLSVVKIHGALRIVLASNNQDILRMQKNLTQADMEALEDRVIFVQVPEECPPLPKDVGHAWSQNDDVACHARWLQENHVVAPAGRLACQPHSGDVRSRLLAHSALHSAILDHVTRQILGQGVVVSFGVGEPSVVVDRQGRVLVNSSLLQTEVRESSAFGAKGTQLSDIQTALASISKGSVKRHGSNRKWRVLDLGTLRAWVELGGDHDWDDIDEALSRGKDEDEKRVN